MSKYPKVKGCPACECPSLHWARGERATGVNGLRCDHAGEPLCGADAAKYLAWLSAEIGRVKDRTLESVTPCLAPWAGSPEAPPSVE